MSCFDNGLLIELKLELEMAMSSLKLLGHHILLNVESVSIRRNQFFFNFSYFHFWPCLLLMAAVCEKANWKRVTKNDTLITETEWRVKDLVFFFSSVLCLVAQLFFETPWIIVPQAPLSMGILQARILKWVAISFSRGSSQLRDWTQVSRIAGWSFTVWATREALFTSVTVLLWI